MAQEIKIQEIASQLTTGSKVSDVDFFWLYAASGQQMKIPAPTARAYLIQCGSERCALQAGSGIGGRNIGNNGRDGTQQALPLDSYRYSS